MMADTKEAENFYRLLTLVTDVANATLQEKFMCCFPGLSFETILNQKKHNILRLWLPQNRCCCPSGTGSRAGSTGSTISKKPVLYESQCKLLFDYRTTSSCSNRNCCCKYVTKTGADPSVLDVTLVTCLLINIANVNASERSIIDKIRKFRNDLQGHCNTARISDVDFNSNWSDLETAIIHLEASCSSSFNPSVQTEIEKLKSKVLDSSFIQHTQHLIQILKKDEEISEIHTKLDQLLRDNDLRRKPHVDHRDREIDISTMELDTTLKNSEFIETQAFQFAEEKINSDNLKGPIVFLGLPGDGKTTLALRLVKELMNGHNFHRTKKHPLIIHGVSECENVKLIDPNSDLVVFIDDMYGKYSVPRQTENTWKGCFPHLEACFSDSSSSSSNVLVVAMRKDIYEVCKASFNDLPMFKSSVIIDLTSDDFKLTQEEKMDIFRSYVSLSDIDDNQVQEICKQSNQIGFPQCCRLYSENKNLQILKSEFFKYPTIHLKQELKRMLKDINEDKQRFCVLVLIMLHGGCLKYKQCFEDSSSKKETQTLKNAAMVCDLQYSEKLGNDLLKDAKSFLGVYVKCSDDGGQYRFSHDSVEQTVVNIMFEENAHFMIKNSKFENFSQLSSDPLRGPSVFTPEKHHYKIIIERISNEVKDEQYRAFTTLAKLDLWNEKEFREQFSESVRLEDVDESTGDNMSLLECGAKTGNYNLVKYICSTKPKRDILQKALDTAGRFGQEKVFSLLSEQDGIVPNIRTFFCVIESGSMTLFRLLLKSNINFNDTCHLGFPFEPISAFQQICLNGNIEMAREFLSRFPRLKTESEHILKSVTIAGYSGSIPFIQYLEDLGADIKQSNVLISASYSGSLDLVRYLIEAGLETTQDVSKQCKMLQGACLSGNFELVKYIAEKYPFLLHMVVKIGIIDLRFACEGGSVDIVEYLIKNGADVNHVDADGNTVIQNVCLSGKIQVLKYLVENYPHLLQQTSQRGETNLHFACFGGSVDAVRYLIKKGADVDQVAIKGRTILHSACFRGKLEVVKYLAEKYQYLLNMKDERGKTNLHYACNRDSVDVVKYLIKKGAKVYDVDADSTTVLHCACFSGKLEIVKYLVENYPKFLNMVDKREKTNLHYACNGGFVDIFKYLIKKGANINHVAADSTTVLHCACLSGKLEIVKYLVEKNPKFLNMVDEREETNLHYACKGGFVDIFKYLKKKGANVYDVDADSTTVLHYACSGKLEIVKYLVENYPDLLHKVNTMGWTSLHYACEGGSVDVVKYLIKNDADVHRVTVDKTTVLHCACFSGKLEIVKCLVENYPHFLHMVDEIGQTNLHYACNGGSVDVVDYLIKKGANVYDVNTVMRTVLQSACLGEKLEIVRYLCEKYRKLLDMVDIFGMTSLHYVCVEDSVNVVKYLIKKFANVNQVTTEMRKILQPAFLVHKLQIVKYLCENNPNLLHMVDNFGMTSLHYACADSSVDVVKYLIKEGADVHYVNLESTTVFHFACFGGKLEIVKYLFENYPDLLHMVDVRGETTLHYACEGGSVDVVKYLIEKGADVNHVATDGRTVLQCACLGSNLEVVKYLAENYPDLLHMVYRRGRTNLQYAADSGSVDVFKYLIEKQGIDILFVFNLFMQARVR